MAERVWNDLGTIATGDDDARGERGVDERSVETRGKVGADGVRNGARGVGEME